jgi:micrococcal nuclease
LLGPAWKRQLAPLLAVLAIAACSSSDSEKPSGHSSGDLVAARVTKHTDGDTLWLSGVGRVRLIGVDTPEVYGGVECYGDEASAFVARLLPLGARVDYRLGVEERDRYGRALAYVWLRDGRFVNRMLVARGYARPLTIPPNVEYAASFVRSSRRAHRAGRGLWGPGGCSE